MMSFVAERLRRSGGVRGAARDDVAVSDEIPEGHSVGHFLSCSGVGEDLSEYMVPGER